MAYSTDSKSAAVRAHLDHPVIDGDGHWLEPVPIFLDYLREVAGPTVVERFRKMATAHIDRGWYDMTPAERLDRRPTRPTWWGEPANTLDRATAMIPKLFYERLDDFGIDFAMLYTSLGLFHIANPDEELRRAIARAVNKMNAEMFRPYAHRIAPAAVVPVHTPQEAIDEATYAVRELGLKVVMIANHVRRPVPAFARGAADPTQVRHFVDSLAYESAYDYDPLWAKCVELKVAVTAHSGSMGWMGRESVNSFVFNLIGHWDKRNGRAMEAHTRPTNLDKQGLKDLFTRFGGRVYEDKMDELMNCLSLVPPFKSAEEMTEREYKEQLDDFAAAHVGSAEKLRRQFTDHFFFGCEADDPTTAWAFDRHGHHRLNPIFSSDVGHFDVTDMSEVLEEAHELVEHGLITPDDFRQFVFGNAARLHTAMNPDFFKGTVVESAVAKELAR